MLTLEETKERILKTYDPDDLLEALQINSEEILERFEDKLINRLEKFWETVVEEETEERLLRVHVTYHLTMNLSTPSVSSSQPQKPLRGCLRTASGGALAL